MMDKGIELCIHNECTGCMACVGACNRGAILIKKDDEGFSYPIIDKELCVSCRVCTKTCPVLSPVSYHSLGDVYAAWSKDDSIRLRSSSGGIFSELAIEVMKKGGVVVGATMDDQGYVSHTLIESAENLSGLQGSKYVQSNIPPELLRHIAICLKEKRRVLFTGTPCQVAGIRKLFKDDENLYTTDMVCHGVPSPEYFARVYKSIKSEFPNMVRYNFRKLNSWSSCSSANIDLETDRTIVNYPLSSKYKYYQTAFLKGYLNRQSCYSCRYACLDRVGDVTMADFWGIGMSKPITEEHKNGCSMLSINTMKGDTLFNEIKKNLYYEKRDVKETIDGGNEQLVKCPLKPKERDSFYKDSNILSVDKVIKKYYLSPSKLSCFLRKICGRIKNKQ